MFPSKSRSRVDRQAVEGSKMGMFGLLGTCSSFIKETDGLVFNVIKNQVADTTPKDLKGISYSISNEPF